MSGAGASANGAAGVGEVIALVDFGSTFTKLRAISAQGALLGSVQHRTTVDTDVFEGLEGALAELERVLPGIEPERMVACSSAGGGLRLGVVGLVEDLTAEAGRMAALSAGARVVRVVSGGLADAAGARELLADAPDILLLVGGTDGGESTTLLSSASALAGEAGDVPIVIAGNVDAQPQAEAVLAAAGRCVVRAPNVMPEIGSLAPDGVRDVIRELFISHVIGGKLAGAEGRLERLVRMATPDAVLTGVELLARVLADRGLPGGVIVVDVGGATTDVHSTLPGEAAESKGYKRSLLPQAVSARTVEADLGMRWNAPGIVDAAYGEGLLTDDERDTLVEPAALRAAEPAYLPDSPFEQEIDCRLARAAIAVALRRHAGQRRVTLTADGAVLERDGRDLTHVPLVLGTGGIFGRIGSADIEGCLALAHRGREERLLPRAARAAVDERYVLAAAGLLAGEDEHAARALLEAELASSTHEPARRI